MEDIFVSKIKRLAVAMFAALCVGNVWGIDAYIGTSKINFNSETLELSVSRDIYTFVNAKKWEMKFVYQYESTSKESICVTNTYAMAGAPKGDWTFGVGETIVLDDFSVGKVLNVECWFEYGGVRITDGGDAENYLVRVFDTRGVLSSVCEWYNDPKKFVLSGRAQGDIINIKIKYIVGSEELETLPENALEAVVTYNEYSGEYEALIDYSSVDDVLSWSVYAILMDGTEKVFKDSSTAKSVLNCKIEEAGNVKYYWTNSKGDGKWNTVGNWDAVPRKSYNGAPGNIGDGKHYTSVACFTNSATVNLGGGIYRLWDTEGESPYRGILLLNGDNENMKVALTNGTVQVEGGSKLWIGKEGVTLEFGDNCVLDGYYMNDSVKRPAYLCVAGGSTVIFSGNSTQPWFFKPIKQGNGQTTFIVKDGAINSKYRLDSDTISDSLTVRIENATWTISTQTPNSGLLGFHDLGARTVFRDGERQAQLKLSSCSGFTLSKVYDFKLPATPFNTPYITGKNLTSISNCTIEVDVTDLAGRARVPLMYFDSLSSNANGWTSVEELTKKPEKLIVTANRRNVKTRQRARLVWDATAKTLYYEQDPVKGFRVIVR